MSSRSQLVLGVLLAATGLLLFLTVATSGDGLEREAALPGATARWVSGTLPADPDGAETRTADPAPVAPVAPGGPTRSATLVAARTGVRVPVLRGGTVNPPSGGLGQWDNGTEPGGKGNLVLATATGGAGAREVLGLRRGDRVVLRTAAYRYVYVMDTAGDRYRAPASARWPLADSPGPTRSFGRRILTLLTSTGADPGAARSVAFGHLEAVRLLDLPGRRTR